MPLKLLLPILVGAILLGAIIWWERPEAVNPFECAVVHEATTSTAIKETAAERDSTTQALSGPELANAIRVIAADLRKKYPNAGDAEIVNYLETAYCPLVARETGLSYAEKRARTDRFSSQVEQILKAR
ncbi:MAG: hypothetical protein ACLPPF_23565 [Rhodomicrobium sp.]